MDVDDHGQTTGSGYVTHVCQGGYKGRVERRGHTTIATNDESPVEKIVEFLQLAEKEYVKFDEPSYSVDGNNDQITITGRTNSPRLAFMLQKAEGMCELPEYFEITVDGQTTSNLDPEGQEFQGDPGASGEIEFEIIITIDANDDVAERTCTIFAEGSKGVVATADIIQGAGASYVKFDGDTTTKTVTFDAKGLSDGETDVDINIHSNDDWTIEVED